MTISIDMWRNLSRVADFHQSTDGYQDCPLPWVASKKAMEVTLPAWAKASTLNGETLLVGSAEQAFIERMLDGTLKPGKWMAITPCFRHEAQYDDLHLPYFMKLELIHYKPAQGSPPQINARRAVEDMLCQAQAGFEMLLGSAPNEARTQLVKTDIGYDLNLEGQEIGSYGYRTFEGHSWVYGTGLAEPRFSTLALRGPEPQKAAQSSYGPDPTNDFPIEWVMSGNTATLQSAPFLTHCPVCWQEFVNIQHPAKPLGVIMARRCGCTPVQVPGSSYNESITVMQPPKVPPKA